MTDLYVSNETGEVLPVLEAIEDYYRTHGPLEAWTDTWELYEAGDLPPVPDFTKTIAE